MRRRSPGPPPRLERIWFRHFSATSVLAELPDGRTVGIAVGFLSPTQPGRGVLLLVAVGRAHRRRGLGRTLVDEVLARLRAPGPVTGVEASVWPGNRVVVRFLQALAFAPVPASLATRLYGVPALEDYDGDGEDRAVLELAL